jgi:hypothetical protein
MLAPGPYKPLHQGPGQLLDGNRRHQAPGESSKAQTMRKLLPEVADPAGKGWPRETKEGLQAADRIAPVSALTQGRDHQKHRGPVNPPAPEEHRGRKHSAPAPGPAAAKTEANRVSLGKIRGASPRLTLIAGVMQRPPTKGHGLARVVSARSESILYRRAKRDLRCRISAGIIAPASVCGQEPPTKVWPKNARGLLCLSPAVLVQIQSNCHLLICPRSLMQSPCCS